MTGDGYIKMSLICSLVPETAKPHSRLKPVVNTELHICSGQNDTCAFEAVFYSPKTAATVSIGTAPAISRLGKVTSSRVAVRSDLPCEMRFMAFHPSDEGEFYADALLEDERVDIMPNCSAGIYFEISVPENAKPGDHVVSVDIYESEMFSDEKKLQTLTCRVRVYPYVMPKRTDMDFHLDLWQHNTVLAHTFGVELWSERHFELIEKAVKELALLGQKAVTLILSNAPWSGQWCHLNRRTAATLYEYSIVPIKKDVNGVFVYDFSIMQRYIDLCARYGIDREITLFGLVNVWCDSDNGFGKVLEDSDCGAKIRYFDEKDGVYKYMRSQAEFDDYMKAIYNYFIDTNQIEKVRLMADEPADIKAYKNALDHMKKTVPLFKLKAAINHSEFIPEFGDRVFDFAPNLCSWSKEFKKISEYQKTMPDKRFLWYVCNNPTHPNTFLAGDLCETLFIGVITSMMGMDGFLRWGFTVWCDDPVKDNRYLTWPCGDLNFVYPSKSGNILPSLRSKALGRAIDLCELLNEVKRRFGREVAQIAYDKVVREKDVRKYFVGEEPISARSMYSTHYSDYDSVREFALSKLSEL